MARKAEAVKHPALMAKALRDRVEAADKVDAESLPGWETFTPDEKQFLMVYPWFGEKKMAAEYIGRNAQWFDRRQRQSQVFKDAVNSRASSTSRIALEATSIDQVALSNPPLHCVGLLWNRSWCSRLYCLLVNIIPRAFS